MNMAGDYTFDEEDADVIEVRQPRRPEAEQKKKELKPGSHGGSGKIIPCPMNAREFKRRFRKAATVPFSLRQVCPQSILQLVSSHAALLGCKEESFFFPLLTCAAGCIGPSTVIELTPAWSEHIVLWTLSLAPITLKHIHMFEWLNSQLREVENTIKSKYPVHIQGTNLSSFSLIEFFDKNGLLQTLKASGGHMLGIYSHPEILQRSILQTGSELMRKLNSGYPLISSIDGHQLSLNSACLSITCGCSPEELYGAFRVENDFFDLLQKYFLFVCAPERKFSFQQMNAHPMIDIVKVFTVLIELHQNVKLVYKLNFEAQEYFCKVCEEFIEKGKRSIKSNIKVFLRNTVSYLARLCCILHALEGAVDHVMWNLTPDPLTWNVEISSKTIKQAKQILDFLVEQQQSLFERESVPEPPNQSESNETSSSTASIIADDVNRQDSTYVLQQKDSFLGNCSESRNNTLSHRSAGRSCARSLSTQNGVDVARNSSDIHVEPRIVSVCSGGLPVTEALTTSVTTSSVPNGTERVLPALDLPSDLSVSVVAGEENEPRNVPSPSVIEIPPDQVPTRNKFSTRFNLSSLPQLTSISPADKQFLDSHRHQIFRLLSLKEWILTPTRVAQLKIFPDNATGNESGRPRFTCSFARHCLTKVARLGFGACRGENDQNLSKFCFMKTGFEKLGSTEKKILDFLGMNEELYNQSFNTSLQNGNGSTRGRKRSLQSTESDGYVNNSYSQVPSPGVQEILEIDS
ncbi:uncharacterized protein LOC106463098 isoform X1 [Limulus polyphemus]|uniref:Uncharacterized protein LOC106463098 isoform X1 n=2 Tax=Limulus polyphemus TaxID=6850 RepID=A0ABM1BB87_LIMPO|nr:uncharacterized protein LOC106463098 isoform X1 [Limulus polyphemus]